LKCSSWRFVDCFDGLAQRLPRLGAAETDAHAAIIGAPVHGEGGAR
jgi:hypothetical protein